MRAAARAIAVFSFLALAGCASTPHSIPGAEDPGLFKQFHMYRYLPSSEPVNLKVAIAQDLAFASRFDGE